MTRQEMQMLRHYHLTCMVNLLAGYTIRIAMHRYYILMLESSTPTRGNNKETKHIATFLFVLVVTLA